MNMLHFSRYLAKILTLGGAGIAILPLSLYAAAFSNGTLIRALNHPEVYLLEKGERRWIPDPETFDRLALSWSAIRVVSPADLVSYPEGKHMQATARLADGLLYRASDSPKVYVIEQGRRRWIPDPRVFSAHDFRWENIHVVSANFLERISEGELLDLPIAGSAPLDVVLLETPQRVTEEERIRFRFAALNVPASDRRDITYETFIEGLDGRWVSAGQNTTRIVTFREGGEFVFYARAKTRDGRASLQPARFAFTSRLSPLFGAVHISSVTTREQNPQREYVRLSSASQTTVSLFGWTIEGAGTGRLKIPWGVEKPTFTVSDAAIPITLGSGEYLTLGSGRSPVYPDAFRVNACMGYIVKSTDFYPSISSRCDKPDVTYLADLSSVCREYIRRLPVCTVPANIINMDVGHDSSCMDYLRSHFTYAGCVRDYQFEAGFYVSREWRAYLSRSVEAWKNTGDTLVLRDANGLVVDRYIYK